VWTENTPSEPGVYWYFDRDDVAICEIVIDEVSSAPFVLLTGDDELYDAVDFTGLWFGPLTPPGPPPRQRRNGPSQ
jgi:hypothetical protein